MPPKVTEDFPEKKQKNKPHCSVADLILLCYVTEIPIVCSFTMYREMEMLTKKRNSYVLEAIKEKHQRNNLGQNRSYREVFFFNMYIKQIKKKIIF